MVMFVVVVAPFVDYLASLLGCLSTPMGLALDVFETVVVGVFGCRIYSPLDSFDFKRDKVIF